VGHWSASGEAVIAHATAAPPAGSIISGPAATGHHAFIDEPRVTFGASVIDLHCHVLPGIDDGPTTIEGSLALARAAAAGGTQVLVATPHVSWRYCNDAHTIVRLVGELNASLAAEGVVNTEGAPLEVRTGAEVALTQIAEIEPAELGRLTLGGGEWLLVEPPFTPVAPHLDEIMLALRADLRAVDGRRVVVAHPERCPAFQRDRRMLERLVQEGFLTSVTAASFGGRFGAEARRFALELARDGLLHNVASDAHDHIHRPPAIAAELEQAGLGPLTQWLTEGVPRAILHGGEIPARPEVTLHDIETPHPRRWLHLRR
jgi:protein-tyrosine phosphatase